MLAGKQLIVPVTTAPDIEIVAHLRAVLGRIARRLRSTAAGAGLTPTQLSVLGTMARHPDGIGLAELARIEGLNPTMLSRAVGRLDELGLLGREPDPVDRRAARVRLTPAGIELHKRVRDERTSALAHTLRQLPTEQVQTLLAALPALDALADALSTPGVETPT